VIFEEHHTMTIIGKDILGIFAGVNFSLGSETEIAENQRSSSAIERSSLDQKGRAHDLMQSSEAAFRRTREHDCRDSGGRATQGTVAEGSETP